MRDKLLEYNKCFWNNNGCGNTENPEVFSFFEKGSYVCLSAPHATKTFVHKKVKSADLFTGCITRYVAEETGVSYILRNKFVPQKVLISDFVIANHLENHFFWDIHAMKDGYGFDLAVGCGYLPAEAYLRQLEFIDFLCRKYGLSYIVNHPSYTGCFGLTGRLQKATGLAQVLQLEWSRRYRDIFTCFDNVSAVTIPFLRELTLFTNRK